MCVCVCVCVCTCKYSNATVREREDGCVSRQERGMFGIGHLILVIGFGASLRELSMISLEVERAQAEARTLETKSVFH